MFVSVFFSICVLGVVCVYGVCVRVRVFTPLFASLIPITEVGSSGIKTEGSSFRRSMYGCESWSIRAERF